MSDATQPSSSGPTSDPVRCLVWSAALVIIVVIVVTATTFHVPHHDHNDANAIGMLKTINTSQTLFREGDKDGDGVFDYGNLLELSNATLVSKSFRF